MTHIEGHVTKRPASDHPDPVYWIDLREKRLAIQRGHCGTCWRSATDHVLELHHRHYDNFGEEDIDDVILLCRDCHEHITSRIRDERYGLGDRSQDLMRVEGPEDQRYRPPARGAVIVQTETPGVSLERFRPASRY